MQRTFILIESNTTGTGRLFVEAARQLGFRTVVLAEDPDRYPGLREHGAEFLQACTSEPGCLRGTMEALAKQGSIAGIFSSSEYFIATAASLAASYGLRGATPAAVSECRNKWMQRRRLAEAGVGTPAWQHVVSCQDLAQALDSAVFPVIVKPVFGTGSIGVRLCRTVQEATAHATEILARRVNERGMPVTPEILIEQYLTGPEYSVEILARSVLGITRKHLSAEPVFVEMGHDFPAQLDSPDAAGLANTALRALEVLGLDWGPAHVELRMTEGGPAIIEVNPRLAGGFIPELIRLAHGVDVIRETIRAAAGEAADIQPQRDHRASIRFFSSPRAGVIDEITGLEEAAEVPGVTDVALYRKPGERAVVHGDFRDRLGHVIACAASGKAAIWAAESGRARISIQVRAE